MTTPRQPGHIGLAVYAAVLSTLPTAASATDGHFSHGIGIKAEGIAGSGIARAERATSDRVAGALRERRAKSVG